MANYNIKIYYQNTRGLRTKTNRFKRNILLNEYDVVLITESWLNDGIGDSELFDDRYIVFRRDRQYSATQQVNGGGVLIAVHRKLASASCPEWSSSAEDIWVTVTYKNKQSNIKKLHFCCLYLCDENRGYNFNSQLSNFTDKLSFAVDSCPNDVFIIFGDFNMKNIIWDLDLSNNITQPTGIQGDAQVYFFDILTECNFNQFNNCMNVNNRVLDWALCNTQLNVCACDDPLVPEDMHHKAINVSLSLVEVRHLTPRPRTIYSYRSGNYDAINSSLHDVDWNCLLYNTTLDRAVENFYNTLYTLIDKFVPQRLYTPNTFPPWYTKPLQKVIKEKYKFLKKFKVYGNYDDYETFSILRNRAKKLEHECYTAYLSTIESAIIEDPKLFWRYVKLNKGTSSSLPSTLIFEGVSTDSGDAACNLFADYFKSNFLSSAASTPLRVDYAAEGTVCNNSLSYIEIDTRSVFKLLKSVDLTKGAGPDRIPPLFIVKCSEKLASPLSMLFTRSIQEGVVPAIWKSAFITPVHKNGDKSNIKNYRPISKLCIFAKLFERIVYTQVYNFLKASFIPEQHGFLKNRSTTSNILLFTEYTSRNMDSGGQVDAVFTDFSKCFDRIDHVILLQKLYNAGIHGNLFRWFSSYIDNRTQKVVVSGYASAWNRVPSGVPQGSLLGPLMFNIFVNDIGMCFNTSKFLLYADDMKIFKKINSINDCYQIQQDLLALEQYCSRNKLDLNVSKCYAITFTHKQDIITYNYQLKGVQLKNVSDIRDLGVTHDTKLAYDIHIDNIVKKANRSLGFIKRFCAQLKSIKAMKILYCSYVRSTLEYCSQVWNPHYNIYIDRIEMTQRKFMRYLQYKSKSYDNTYEGRCSRHHILPLELRREISDTIFFTKIAQSQVDSPELLSLIGLRVPTRSVVRASRMQTCLNVPWGNTNYRCNSFLIRTSKSINNLESSLEFDLFVTPPHILKRKMSSKWFKIC